MSIQPPDVCEVTSPTLLLAVRAGDDQAWQRLVRLYGPLLVRWCERCGLQESDAFDVSQEVLVALAQSLHRFEHRNAVGATESENASSTHQGGSFRAWMWSIARNKIADHHRRLAGKPTAGGGTEALQYLLSLPDQSPETIVDVTDLHLRALNELRLSFTQQTWTAFWRVVVEKDAAKDVAEDLGITVWAVYKAKSRILARLQQEFGEAFR